MRTRTRRGPLPEFTADALGHPQVVTMMPAIFGGATMRQDQPGLTTCNSLPTLLSFGEVWTSGTSIAWVIGTGSDNGSMGSFWVQASTGDDDVEIIIRGGASGRSIERGTAKLPGQGLRRVDLSLWVSGSSGLCVAPAAVWHITNEESD